MVGRGSPVDSRSGVIAVVVWLLGVPALAGEAAVGGRDPSSVVLATADYAVVCGGATTSPSCTQCLAPGVLDKLKKSCWRQAAAFVTPGSPVNITSYQMTNW